MTRHESESWWAWGWFVSIEGGFLLFIATAILAVLASLFASSSVAIGIAEYGMMGGVLCMILGTSLFVGAAVLSCCVKAVKRLEFF